MRLVLRLLVLIAAALTTAFGLPVLSLPFSTHYSIVDLGIAPGGMGGSLVVSAGDPNTLLIGRAGEIDAVGVTRDPTTRHITGFTGTSTSVFSTSPSADGGMAYAPNGTLLYVVAPSSMGEIMPGSTSTDRVVNAPLDPAGGGGGGLAFVPAGFSGAGNFVMSSYGNGIVCTVPLTPDGSGTYDLAGSCSNSASIGVGPEGIFYVPLLSPQFSGPTVLIAEYLQSRVSAYAVDANGLPVPSTRQDFLTRFQGYGATFDRLTGDLLMVDWSDQRFIEVNGFSPEPGTLALAGAALALLALRRRRR